MSEEVDANNLTEHTIPDDHISLLVVHADLLSLQKELSNMSKLDELPDKLTTLLKDQDSRIKAVPIRFPMALNSNIVSIFVHAALFLSSAHIDTVVYMVVDTGNGRILDVRVPVLLNTIAPHLNVEEKN